MPSYRTIFQRLRKYNDYLSNYHQSHRSARFEELVCQAFACLLHLPFYNSEDDDTSKNYRVTWLGSASSSSKAPSGPDGIGRAHDFYIVIEATRKTGTKQWSQEFARCVDHVRDFAQNNNIDPSDLYTMLMTTEIHNDTYNSVKTHNVSDNFKIVLLEVDPFLVAVETSLLAFTIRHLETRNLILDLLDCLSDASSLQNYRDRAKRCFDDWQKKVLKLEKTVILAIKSYEAMMKEDSTHVGVSQILIRLIKHPVVKWYLGKIDCDLNDQIISKSLLAESLGDIVGKTPDGEDLFCPVPLIEFKSRCQRRLQAVEGAYERK